MIDPLYRNTNTNTPPLPPKPFRRHITDQPETITVEQFDQMCADLIKEIKADIDRYDERYGKGVTQ